MDAVTAMPDIIHPPSSQRQRLNALQDPFKKVVGEEDGDKSSHHPKEYLGSNTAHPSLSPMLRLFQDGVLPSPSPDEPFVLFFPPGNGDRDRDKR